MIDLVAEQIIKGIIVSNSKTGITCSMIGSKYNKTDLSSETKKLKEKIFSEKYSECVGEAWPLAKNEKKMNEYLQSIPGLNAFFNERGEMIWYIRGKTFNDQTRGQICRARPIKKSPSNRLRDKKPNNNVVHQTNYQHSNQMSDAGPQLAVPFYPR